MAQTILAARTGSEITRSIPSDFSVNKSVVWIIPFPLPPPKKKYIYIRPFNSVDDSIGNDWQEAFQERRPSECEHVDSEPALLNENVEYILHFLCYLFFFWAFFYKSIIGNIPENDLPLLNAMCRWWLKPIGCRFRICYVSRPSFFTRGWYDNSMKKNNFKTPSRNNEIERNPKERRKKKNHLQR